VGPAKPRQPAVPRPGHAPTPCGRRVPPVPRAGPPSRHPRTAPARRTTWRCHGRRPRLGSLSRHPYLVRVVSQAQCKKIAVPSTQLNRHRAALPVAAVLRPPAGLAAAHPFQHDPLALSNPSRPPPPCNLAAAAGEPSSGGCHPLRAAEGGRRLLRRPGRASLRHQVDPLVPHGHSPAPLRLSSGRRS
jgi:hypothetical protein